MLLLTLAHCTRFTFDLPQEENVEKNAYFVLTQTGMERYGQRNLDAVFKDIIGKSVGNLSLSVVGFDVNLHNIIITEMTNPKIGIVLFPESNSGSASMNKLGFRLAFEFQVLRNTAPYFDDRGTGTLYIEVNDIHMYAQAFQSPNCPGQLNVGTTNEQCHISNLQITFTSSMSFLYNAITPILADILTEQFNQNLGGTLISQLIDYANNELDSADAAIGAYHYSVLNVDSRWIGDVLIKDRQFEVAQNGAACLLINDTNLCGKDSPRPAPKRCLYVMNTDLTYEISINAFNSLMSFLWELNQTDLAESLNVTYMSVAVSRVAKSGIVTEIYYERGDYKNTIQCIGGLNTKQTHWATSSMIHSYFGLRFDRITDRGSESPETADAIVKRMEYVLDFYAYVAMDGNNLDLEHAQVVYCDSNWVFVGVNVLRDGEQ